MKKRILALLLTLALVLPAVSCDVLLADPNGPATPVDSQSPSNTPKDTEKAPVSVTPETQPQTPPDDEPEDSEPNRDPDEAQTEYVEPETEYIEPETTVEPETEEPLPYVEKEAAGLKAHSIDSFFANGEMYFDVDGQAGDRLTAQENKVVFKTGETAQSIALRGWIGFEQPIASFGYYIDNYDFIYGDFATPTEDAVIGIAGEFASRYLITVPLNGLEVGEHMVGFAILLADGTVVRLREELLVVIEKNEWTNKDIVTHHSFDALYYDETDRNAIFNDGQSASWDFVADLYSTPVDTLTYWGWLGFKGELGQFGYQINGGTPVYDDAWAWETEQAVIDASKSTGADSGQRMKIAISLAGLEGTNTVTVLYKNAEGDAVVLNEFIVNLPSSILETVPEHLMDTEVTLGIRGSGGPYSAAKSFGQRFTVTGGYLTRISINDMATYADGNRNTWMLKIWAWNNNYDTTVSGNPWYIVNGTNHNDNTTFTVDIPLWLGVTGDVYYELTYLSGSGQFTGWIAQEYVAEGVETYVSGQWTEGTYASSIGIAATHYANYNVPQDQWVISGHRPQLQNSSDGMVADAGVEYAALLYQGSIYLGEIDLSKYSKVVIYWGADNSQVTIDRYNENAHNRIMLLNQDMNMVMSPEEHTVIAGSTYTLHGWKVEAHEIDLTGIDYSGPVYVTWDTLPGTFMLISSVEFIGGEIE